MALRDPGRCGAVDSALGVVGVVVVHDVVGEDQEPDATYDERVGVGMRYGLYIAFDFELGVFASQPETSLGLLALLSAGIEHRFGPITLGG